MRANECRGIMGAVFGDAFVFVLVMVVTSMVIKCVSKYIRDSTASLRSSGGCATLRVRDGFIQRRSRPAVPASPTVFIFLFFCQSVLSVKKTRLTNQASLFVADSPSFAAAEPPPCRPSFDRLAPASRADSAPLKLKKPSGPGGSEDSAGG